jgi:hypothetical protein
MIKTKAVIRFTSHTAHIQVDHRGIIQIFKYHDRSCDFDVFEDQYEASDYILTPPADCYYRVVFSGEE